MPRDGSFEAGSTARLAVCHATLERRGAEKLSVSLPPSAPRWPLHSMADVISQEQKHCDSWLINKPTAILDDCLVKGGTNSCNKLHTQHENEACNGSALFSFISHTRFYLQLYGKWSCNTMEKLLATFFKKYLQKTPLKVMKFGQGNTISKQWLIQ